MSSSENRQKTKLMTVRLRPEEYDRVRLAAEQEGLSISELVLSLMQRSAPGLVRPVEATRIAS